ncbi:MAG: hypothetical protein ABFD83_14780 [Armatimonadota bacterium]
MADDNPKIISKEEFFRDGRPAEDVLFLPELGPDKAVRVRGFSIGGMATIQAASHPVDEKGKTHYDSKQDRLLSVVYIMTEPKLSLEDTGHLLEIADGIADKIIEKGLSLSYRSQDMYEGLKTAMKQNPYVRRLYTVCVEKLGRFPAELDAVSEEEFMRYLAAAEVEAELDVEALKEKALEEETEKTKGE